MLNSDSPPDNEEHVSCDEVQTKPFALRSLQTVVFRYPWLYRWLVVFFFLNLVIYCLPSHWNYAVDYLVYFSRGFQVVWFLAFVAVLIVAYWQWDALVWIVDHLPQCRGVWLLAFCIGLYGCFWGLRNMYFYIGDGYTKPITETCKVELPSPKSVYQSPDKCPRLDDIAQAAFFAAFCRYFRLDNLPELPSIRSNRLFHTIGGTFVILILCLAVRRMTLPRPVKLLFLLCFVTSLFTINFYGNCDAYACPMLCSAVFFYCLVVWDRHNFWYWPATIAVLLSLLLAVWAHPFNVMLVLLGAEMIRIRIPAQWVKTKLALCSALAVIFSVVVHLAQLERFWFRSKPSPPTPPFFSISALKDYLNGVAFPSLVLSLALLYMVAARRQRGEGKQMWCVLLALLSFHVTFVQIGFARGFSDQFTFACYTFNCILLVVYSLMHLGVGDGRALLGAVCINLYVLVPGVWVFHTEKIIQRGWVLFPKDDSSYSTELTWQTHFGIQLGDNIAPQDSIIKSNVLAIFSDGANNAKPEGKRFKNLCCYVAWHYHFEEFKKGKALLKALVVKYPQSLGAFFSDRPCFIFYHRLRLLDDLREIVLAEPLIVPEGTTFRTLDKAGLLKQIDAQRAKIQAEPNKFFMKKDSWH